MAGQKFFLLKNSVYKIIGPYFYEKIRHIFAHRRVPRLEEPTTFNDKVGYRKIYERDIAYPVIADKALVRNIVTEKLGSTILTDVFYCGGNVGDIKFGDLPDNFVLKATHGSGPDFISFIHSKHHFHEEMLKTKMQHLINKDYGYITNEWWYTKIKHQVMVEEMLKDDIYGIPIDYKLFVFHGEVQFIQVDYSRFKNHTRTFYDKEWQPQEFSLKYPRGQVTARPKLLQEMIKIGESLGKDFDFIRVDLYCVNDVRVVFGELTLSPEGGWGRFNPVKWDFILGKMW